MIKFWSTFLPIYFLGASLGCIFSYNYNDLFFVLLCFLFLLERLSMTLRQTGSGKNETFAVCLQQSVQ